MSATWLKKWLGMSPRKSSGKTRRSRPSRRAELEQLEQRDCPAVTVQFDYRFDDNNFWTPERKAVLERATTAMTAQFTDNLAAIVPSATDKWKAVTTNPTTNLQIQIDDLPVPEDTLIVFAGARALENGISGRAGPGTFLLDFATVSQEFNAIVRGRGQAGALATPATDYSPWGGMIQIDNQNPSADPESYYALFQHEMMHVLGFGTAASWTAKTTPNPAVAGTPNFFTGAQAKAKYDANPGGNVPLQDSVDAGGGNVIGPTHWKGDVTDGGVTPRIGPGGGTFLTGLDRAGLGDIGWSLRTDTDGEIANARNSQVGAGQVTFSITTEEIENPIDADLYKFSGNLGDVVTLFTSARDGRPTVDTFLRVFDSLGNQLEVDDNSGAQAGYSRLVFTLPATGDFYAGISSAPNRDYLAAETYARGDAGGTGAYSLTITKQQQVAFTTSTQVAAENANPNQVIVTVQLAAPAATEVKIPFTLGGNALPQDDYAVQAPLEITIAAGQSVGAVTVNLLNDVSQELDEDIELTLQTPNDPNVLLGAVTKHTITILDDDTPLPTVGFTIAAPAAATNEAAAATIEVEVSLSAAHPQRDISVGFTTTGTAAKFLDYTVSPAVVVIPKGQTSAKISLQVINDALLELDETAILTLVNPTNATLNAAKSTHTVTINDDDRPTVKITTTGTTTVEKNPAPFVEVFLESSKSFADLFLNIPITVSGTATAGQDYNVDTGGPANNVQFPMGSTTTRFLVRIIDDPDVEDPEETIVITLGLSRFGTPVTPTSLVIKLLDNDRLPTFKFKQTSTTLNEKSPQTSVIVEASGPYKADITIPISIVAAGSTAEQFFDYNTTPNFVQIFQGDLTGDFALSVIDDGQPEPTETAIFKLGTPQGGGSVVAPDTFTLTIVDGNTALPPVVQFTTAAQNVNEGASVTITARLAAAAAQPVSIPFTISGSATNGTDFSITPATPLTIPAGQTDATLTLNALADLVVDLDETVKVQLGTPPNAILGTQSSHTVTIKDVALAVNPLVKFTTTQLTLDEGKESKIRIQLAAPTAQPVVVTYELTGGTATEQIDFNLSPPSPVTIPAGSTFVDLTLVAEPDTEMDDNEKVVITITGVTNATLGADKVHTTTIKDVVLTPVTANFSVAAQEGAEGDTKEFTVTVTLSGPAPKSLFPQVEISGVAKEKTNNAAELDYEIIAPFGIVLPFTVSIAKGETSGSFKLKINDDALMEPNETAIFTLAAGAELVNVGTTNKTHTFTIKDNDQPPAPKPGQLAFANASASIAEDKGTITLAVSRTGGSEGTVSASYTVTIPSTLLLKNRAEPGKDFSGSLTGTVSFANAETTKNITFTVLTDNLVEVTESFLVTLSAPTGGATLGSQSSTTVNILDVNIPPVPNEAANLERLKLAGEGFGKSEEHYKDFVSKAYARFLNRQPDAAGFTYWVTLMQRYETSKHKEGLRQEQIEAGFIDSPEYKGLYGGTAGEAWVRGIYKDLLGRAADEQGVRFWLGQLAAGVSPTNVALGFTASDERLTNRVTETYRTLLQREPDAPGLAYWIAIFKDGGTTEDINSGFVGSPEYYAKANSAASNPAKWIRDAYLDILFRPARVDELEYWFKFLKG